MGLFNTRFKKSGNVVIDGKSFSGNDISISAGGKVIIDGVQQEGSLINNISIQIYGDVESIETVNGDITTTGNIKKVETVNGDVSGGVIETASTVNGDIST